jgi:ubiquinone/menaquinone biosynthesis C-methylase UbiE
MGKIMDEYYAKLAIKKMIDAEQDLSDAYQHLIDAGSHELVLKSFKSSMVRITNFRYRIGEYIRMNKEEQENGK